MHKACVRCPFCASDVTTLFFVVFSGLFAFYECIFALSLDPCVLSSNLCVRVLNVCHLPLNPSSYRLSTERRIHFYTCANCLFLFSTSHFSTFCGICSLLWMTFWGYITIMYLFLAQSFCISSWRITPWSYLLSLPVHSVFVSELQARLACVYTCVKTWILCATSGPYDFS